MKAMRGRGIVDNFPFVPVTPAMLSMYSSVIGLTTISPPFS